MSATEFQDMSAATLDRILTLMHEVTGITMPRTKQSLLQGRLRPRLRSLGLRSYDEYVHRLTRHHDERQVFANLVTTHQTSFFRTRRIWDYLLQAFLPAFRREHAGATLRVWSAAASTGEEAYSIAMCCEEIRRDAPDFAYEVVGTDISTEVLEVAARGVYTGRVVSDLQASHPDLFERYNAASSHDHFTLAPAIRRRVTFAAHDIFTPYPRAAHFDLIFLRNVLIYFSPNDRERAVRGIASALTASGQLIIGESESLTGQQVPFQFREPQVYGRAPP